MSSEAVEALKKEIWKRAKERAEKIMREAEAEAEKIVSDARKEVENFMKNRLKPEKALLRRKIIGKALMEGRKMLLTAKNEVIEEVFSKALERLREFTETEEYRKFLLKCLGEGINELKPSDGEEVIIYANKKDLPFLSENLHKLYDMTIRFKLREGRFMGGVIVANSDETKIFYNTIESRLEALRPTLREQVASMLFKGAEKE